MNKEFGWCVVIDGSNDTYVSAYCHFKNDAEELIKGKEHWQKVVHWTDACDEFNVPKIEQSIGELLIGY